MFAGPFNAPLSTRWLPDDWAILATVGLYKSLGTLISNTVYLICVKRYQC